LGASERFVFEAKKLLKNIKDLKTVKRCSKLKKQTVAAEKRVTTAIAQNLLKENGSLLVPTRRCFARICGPGSLLYILIIKWSCSQMAGSRTQPYLLWEHCYALENQPPKLTGLRHLERIAAQGQYYGSPKNGHSEANSLAIAGCQS
jgi:hypothetical protein